MKSWIKKNNFNNKINYYIIIKKMNTGGKNFPINKENNLNISNNDENVEPLYIMTLELQEGKAEQLKIYSNSDSYTLASNFCQEHGLDNSACDYLKEKIENLMNQYREVNNIDEIEEEQKTESTKSNQKKTLLFSSGEEIEELKDNDDSLNYSTEKNLNLNDNFIINDNNQKDEDKIFNEKGNSLTLEDLEKIEESMPPLSYEYQTYDMQSESVVDTGSYEVAEWEEAKFFIPEYETMVSREVVSSAIEDDMIYTTVKMTLEDGTVLNVLYINEPDTLFCRAISVENWDKTTLYSNFTYDADVQ